MQDLDINITKINELRTQPNVHTEQSHRNFLVKCYCSDDDRKKLKDALEKYYAKEVKIELTQMDERRCNCVVTYSVWDEKGSFLQSLRAFEVIIIIMHGCIYIIMMHQLHVITGT